MQRLQIGLVGLAMMILLVGLATIIRDVPIEVSWDDLVLSQRDDEALKALFNEFEFRTFTKRLFGEAAATASGRATSAVSKPTEEPTLFESFRTIRAEADRVTALEREVRELRRTNEILRKASAFFAAAELDRLTR